MRKNLLHTSVALILASLVLAVYLLLKVKEGEVLIAVLILGIFLACASFPTYLAVLVYHFVKKKLRTDQKVYATLSCTLALVLLYHLAFALYMTITYGSSWKNLIGTISYEYTRDFLVVSIPAIVLAICIPLAEILVEKMGFNLKGQQ